MQEDIIHKEHRKRKKNQFLQNGADAFSDHELLELLLYFAIPRIDTNATAHKLINRFGTLDAVMNAPVEELKRVEGVGESAATLIHLIVPLYRRSRMSAVKGMILNSMEAVGDFLLEQFAGERNEVFYEVCLDAKCKVLGTYKLAVGDAFGVETDIRSIVENALLCRAYAVVLAHNHPSGVALPSEADNRMTLEVKEVLRTIGVRLLDHIIVADDDYVSLRQNGLFH